MLPDRPATTVVILVVLNDVINDRNIIFGSPFIEMCDSVSLKPAAIRWLGDEFMIGIAPRGSTIHAVTLDTKFMTQEDMNKFFVPYLPDSINAAQQANISPYLTTKERSQVILLIQEFEDCFTSDFNDVDVGMELKIHLKNPKKVIAVPHRQLSAADAETQRTEVREMLRMGVIRPSMSNFNSPTVLVKNLMRPSDTVMITAISIDLLKTSTFNCH